MGTDLVLLDLLALAPDGIVACPGHQCAVALLHETEVGAALFDVVDGWGGLGGDGGGRGEGGEGGDECEGGVWKACSTVERINF